MHLTKRQSIVLACSLIGLFFIAGNFLLGRRNERNLPEAPPPLPQAAAAPTLPGSALTLGEFHRSETRDGKKLWEVRAVMGQYFPEEKKAVLRDATLWFYKSDGDKVSLASAEAELFFDEASLARASLVRDVRVVLNEKVRLATEAANYDAASRTVHAPGRVTIESDAMQIIGEELQAQIDSREFVLKRNVSTAIAARPQRDERKTP